MIPAEPEPVPAKPQGAIYAPEPMPTVNPRLFSGVDGGPGEGPDMGGPNAVSTGMISQGTADTIESGVASMLGFQKGEQGYQPTVATPAAPMMLGNLREAVVQKGAAKLGRWSVDKAKDAFGWGKRGGYGVVGPNPSQGFGGWGKGQASAPPRLGLQILGLVMEALEVEADTAAGLLVPEM